MFGRLGVHPLSLSQESHLKGFKGIFWSRQRYRASIQQKQEMLQNDAEIVSQKLSRLSLRRGKNKTRPRWNIAWARLKGGEPYRVLLAEWA